MSYFHIAEENLPLGCGADCPCSGCRSASLGFGERYTKAEVDREPRPPRPRSGSPTPSVPSEAEQTAGWFGEQPAGSAAVAFRYHPDAVGCTNARRLIIRRAILDAISLAENAAAKLAANDSEALRLFRFFFGDPTRPVPWANNRLAADLVAHRFREVGRAFRTRVPHFRCRAGAVCTNPDGSARGAFVTPRAAPTAANPLPRNTILLCAGFWTTANAAHRGAMLLHEMLHLLFWEFFGHQPNLPRPGDPEERRRDNSYCYHVFALRVAEHGAPQIWRDLCTNRPA